MSLHILPPQIPALEVLGDSVKILLSSSDTNSQSALVQLTVGVGCGVPPHVHEKEDEIFYIVKGSVEFHLGGKTVVAREGETVFGPRKIAHGFQVVGSEPAIMNVTITPGGMEEMFVQVSALPAPHDFKRVAEICDGFGIRFLPQG